MIGKILKVVLIVAILSVLVLLGINIFKADNKAYDGITITDEFKEAYKISSDIRTHEASQNSGFSPNGGLYCYGVYYIEESGYLQLLIRYNKKHMDEISESFPDFKEEDIRFTLTDNNGKVYNPKIVDSATKYHYVNFILEFTDIDFKDATLTLNMIIDVIADKVGKDNSVTIHKSNQNSVEYKLTTKQQESL